MANDFFRRSVSSGIRGFLLFSFVLCYRLHVEVVAGSIEAEAVAIGDVRSNNFDEENKSISWKSEEAPTSNDLTEETPEDDESNNLLQRYQKNSRESRKSFFTKKNGDEDNFDKNFDDFFDHGDGKSAKSDVAGIIEDNRLTILGEKPVVLPVRFVYVARESYRSWTMPSRPVNNPRAIVEGRNSEDDRKKGEEEEVYEDDYSGPKNDEKKNEHTVEGKKSGLGWRNIIGGPTFGCPPGERKDRNGCCRIIIW